MVGGRCYFSHSRYHVDARSPSTVRTRARLRRKNRSFPGTPDSHRSPQYSGWLSSVKNGSFPAKVSLSMATRFFSRFRRSGIAVPKAKTPGNSSGRRIPRARLHPLREPLPRPRRVHLGNIRQSQSRSLPNRQPPLSQSHTAPFPAPGHPAEKAAAFTNLSQLQRRPHVPRRGGRAAARFGFLQDCRLAIDNAKPRNETHLLGLPLWDAGGYDKGNAPAPLNRKQGHRP